MFIQLATICEEEDLELTKEVHCFDLKSNEWHIAIMQIYENLFKDDAHDKNERGELRFDEEGNVLENEKGVHIEENPNMA